MPIIVIGTLDSCSPRAGETLDTVGPGPGDGEGDDDGLIDADGLMLGDTDADGLSDALGLMDADGLMDGERDADGLIVATVNVPDELKVCMVSSFQ